MLRSCFTLLIFLLSLLSVKAQNWVAVGTDDFAQVTLSGTSEPSLYADSANSLYIVYIDTSYGIPTAPKRILVRKNSGTGWATIGQYITQGNTYFDHAVTPGGKVLLALDSSGAGNIFIILKQFDGSNWTTLGLPYAATGLAPLKLRLDPLGNPYLLWGTTYPFVLKHDGNAWTQTGPAVNTITAVNEFDLAIDSTGTPYIAYNDALYNNNVSVARLTGNTWVNIGSPGFGGASISNDIAIHNDTVYLASGISTGNIRLFDGTSWQTLATLSGQARPKLAFDTAGNCFVQVMNNNHLAVYNVNANGATLAGYVSVGTQFTQRQGIAVAGSVYIFGQDNDRGGKTRVWRLANTGLVEDYPATIEPFHGSKPYHGLLADNDGELYVVKDHAPTLSNSGGVAKWNGTSWQLLSVSMYNVGGPVTFGVDTADRIYRLDINSSPTPNQLINRFIGVAWSSFNTTFSNTNSSWGSFAIDDNNKVYVAYVDNTFFGGNRIRVKESAGNSWQDVSLSTPFISTGVAQHTITIVDSLNRPLVLFREAVTGELVLKYFDGANWLSFGSSVDTIADTDYNLALTPDNEPVVAYRKLVNGNLRPVVRKYDGTGWVTLGTAGFSYGAASALDITTREDSVYVAYRDSVYKHVVVARYDGTSWGALDVVASADTSNFPNIITSNGEVYLSYYSGGLFVRRLAGGTVVPFSGCPPVDQLTVSGITDSSAQINWAGANIATGYQYALNTSNSLPGSLTSTTSGSTSLSGLLPNTTYYFFVRSVCGADTSAWDTVSFTTPVINSVPYLPQTRGNWLIYPNPAKDQVTIRSVAPSADAILLLCDAQGRTVRSMTMTGATTTVDLQGLPSGIYLLRCTSEADTGTYRILKQ